MPTVTTVAPVTDLAVQGALRRILDHLAAAGPTRLDTPGVPPVVLPDVAVEMLRQACTALTDGGGVAVTGIAQELTTGEAAKMLGLARTALIDLLNRGQIASRRVGTHRRISLADLLAYHRKLAAKQWVEDERGRLVRE